jgi:RNA polymerase subunit RPABC4/transcription elongation factor Spt4
MIPMGKKECPSCAMEVDEKSKECPICGYEFPESSRTYAWIALLLAIILLLFLLF